MPFSICTACGTQYPESPRPPEQCIICEEERQYVPPRGQTWTTLDALSKSHMNAFHEYDTGIIGIGSQPAFAIGQRALLVRTERGNVLWDCIATLDVATISMIKGLGGLKAIAISHPHFYTTMVEWARAFDCPIHLNSVDILTVATDRKWLSFMRSYPNFIPLSAREVGHIGEALAPFQFDLIYGHYFDRVIAKNAKQVLEKSVVRYVAAINGTRGY
jgi:hypothetical protein